MNYIKEDDFDFYAELNGGQAQALDQQEQAQALDQQEQAQALDQQEQAQALEQGQKCLISHLPLTYNAITLPCNHSFNYLPLFKELCMHHVSISCPYCRTVSAKLLPYIPLPGVTKIRGVNSPNSKCMPAPACTVIAVKKGTSCGRNGMACAEGIFCAKHLIKTRIKKDVKRERIKSRLK